MKLARLTGSLAALVHHCTHLLGDDVAWNETPEGAKERAKGVTTHRMLAAVANDGVLEATDDVDIRALYAAGRAWMDQRVKAMGARRPVWRGEVALAYDPTTDTARELVDAPGVDARWYALPELRAAYAGPGGPVRDTEICMRLDLAAMGMDEEGAFAWVADYKCHFGPDAISAKDQLELAALAASRAWNVDRVKVVGVHLWTDRPTVEEPYELTAFGLDDVARFYAELAAAPAPGEANDGPWCTSRHCKARATCPRTQEAAKELEALIPAEQLTRGRSVVGPLVTNEDGAQRIVTLQLLEELIAVEWKRVDAFADAQGGILTKTGEVYSGKDEPAESPNLAAAGAVEVLEKLGLDFAIKQSTSFQAIKANGGQPRVDEARAQLRAIGALKVTARLVYKARAQSALRALVPALVAGEPANERRAS